jgi:hypothetical protein
MPLLSLLPTFISFVSFVFQKNVPTAIVLTFLSDQYQALTVSMTLTDQLQGPTAPTKHDVMIGATDVWGLQPLQYDFSGPKSQHSPQSNTPKPKKGDLTIARSPQRNLGYNKMGLGVFWGFAFLLLHNSDTGLWHARHTDQVNTIAQAGK